MTDPSDEEMLAELQERIGSEFDDQLNLGRVEAEALIALARAGLAAQARADDALAQLDLERAESALAFSAEEFAAARAALSEQGDGE